MKVKIFLESKLDTLENRINEFASKYEITDVKLQLINTNGFMALVLYKDGLKC